ncbi:MAG TPA: hypothetical protein ENN12_02585 [Epsilonproteobacteria bacterium]|nr:hypothetical protein [Campylobacterota bacterium]
MKKENNNRDLEFTNTTLIEVDDTSLLGYTFATYGVRQRNILTLDNVYYKDNNIEKLTALQGVYDTKSLTLRGDVDLYYKDGMRCQSQEAIYYKELSKLEIPTPFVATTPLHIFRGSSLIYDANKRTIKAKEVNALIDMNTSK